MITKNDCMSILVQMEDSGINIDSYMRKLAISPEIPVEVLKFISQNRGMEVQAFYEMLRKRHNQKKSKLYINLVKEIDDPAEVITTLTGLLMQINLYGRKLGEEATAFYRAVRAEEISRIINDFYVNNQYENAVTLIKLIKADILVLEYIAGRRDLD